MGKGMGNELKNIYIVYGPSQSHGYGLGHGVESVRKKRQKKNTEVDKYLALCFTSHTHIFIFNFTSTFILTLFQTTHDSKRRGTPTQLALLHALPCHAVVRRGVVCCGVVQINPIQCVFSSLLLLLLLQLYLARRKGKRRRTGGGGLGEED